ncbi:hypothetical protein ACVI1J_010130 [Bradyrhizobium diazoefficiens]
MKARIERERFLKVLLVRAFRPGRVEDQIPAVIGHHTWDHDEFVLGQERITERLLARAWDSRSQPIGVRNVGSANDLNVGHVGDMKRGQYVRQSVERFEAFVNRHSRSLDQARNTRRERLCCSTGRRPGMRLRHYPRSTQSAPDRGAKR